MFRAVLIAARAIKARRGRVHLVDRAVLKAQACPCYEAIAAQTIG